MTGVERTDESVGELFPDRGPPPSNEVVVDLDAEPTPDTGHPARLDEREPEAE
jgi:hypothetical protein